MTRRALALHLLREASSRGITTAEFLQAGVGSRYSARLLELRREGHVIEAERIREGSWKYVLVHDAAGGAGNPTEDSFFTPSAARGVGVGAAVHSQAASPQAYRGDRTDSGAPPPTPAPDSPGAGAGTLFPPPAERPRSAALHDYEDEAA